MSKYNTFRSINWDWKMQNMFARLYNIIHNRLPSAEPDSFIDDLSEILVDLLSKLDVKEHERKEFITMISAWFYNRRKFDKFVYFFNLANEQNKKPDQVKEPVINSEDEVVIDTEPKQKEQNDAYLKKRKADVLYNANTLKRKPRESTLKKYNIKFDDNLKIFV